MEESNPELESFRQQWKAEFSARAQVEGSKHHPTSTGSSKSTRRPPAPPRIAAEKVPKNVVEEEEHANGHPFLGLDAPRGGISKEESSKPAGTEPQSALEHYEKAVEKEAQGRLGDSLNHYRKAFKLDHRVDLTYKNKHFPSSSFISKPPNTHPATDQVTKITTAHHSLDGTPQPINQLIAGFSSLSIEPALPAVEEDPVLPCPLATLPGEILVYIFRELAIIDVASFVRLAQVCKRMAYLVATEEQIWRRVCEGSEVGFAAMHYQFQVEIHGGPLEDENFPSPPSDSPSDLTPELIAPFTNITQANLTSALLQSLYSSSWQQMFRLRPRIRFNGCYISTNNYIRPGQAAPSQLTWSSPVHIVTYYRYLRFFRDGSAISLLTTAEPFEVVHHLTFELLATHRNGANAHLPSAVMQHALRGRWKLIPAAEHPEGVEGDLCVETDGVGPKYMYRQDLSLRSAGKGARNNKLAWSAYWLYNRLTDDWAEFSRRNEKPLFWSRVRSYGNGA